MRVKGYHTSSLYAFPRSLRFTRTCTCHLHIHDTCSRRASRRHHAGAHWLTGDWWFTLILCCLGGIAAVCRVLCAVWCWPDWHCASGADYAEPPPAPPSPPAPPAPSVPSPRTPPPPPPPSGQQKRLPCPLADTTGRAIEFQLDGVCHLLLSSLLAIHPSIDWLIDWLIG